jgi:TldD protein
MNVTRRRFLVGSGMGSLAAWGAAGRSSLVEARSPISDPLLQDTVARALAAAKKAGASYADIRIVRRRDEDVQTREDHVVDVDYQESYGLGVRVVCAGAWGFASSSMVLPGEGERVARLAVDIAKANARVIERPVNLAPTQAHVAVWQTPLGKDPFKIPVTEKVELLLAINKQAMAVRGVKFCESSFSALGEWKLFASSEGASIEQQITRIAAGYEPTAVNTTTGEFVTRAHELAPMQAGWEYIEGSTLLADARKIGEDTVEKLKAAPVTPGKRDLVLAPSHLWLTIHESIGHPTELDRALGYEANYAGTSFITPARTGKLRLGSPIVNVYADKTTPRALATVGYDDEGVKTQRWDVVRNGIFVGWQTTREQAAWIGEKESRGTSYAQDYRSFPFQRMPNVSLAPAAKNLSAADLIAATDDGIFITGNGSFSIDHQRYNFQFGGQMFYEIKKGKITRALRDVAYQSRTPDFWQAADLVGGEKDWFLGGALNDGKGEPSQSNAVSHGCPPTRFRQIDVINTGRKRA